MLTRSSAITDNPHNACFITKAQLVSDSRV